MDHSQGTPTMVDVLHAHLSRSVEPHHCLLAAIYGPDVLTSMCLSAVRIGIWLAHKHPELVEPLFTAFQDDKPNVSTDQERWLQDDEACHALASGLTEAR